MIPLKIQIKNFLSYGPTLQTIDFTPYQLICLSGKNGHGKSALLDAITWSIWGQARKISSSSKPDAHLLRLGQTHMLVIFDFSFNDQQYRIRREYAVTHGKQYASLDFGIVKNSKSISLTRKTIRDTQTIIEKTLGLDFESFINSAFLRQGQSNEFSKKSPKERKDILGSILGLNHYELIRKRALEKVKLMQTEVGYLTKFQEKIAQELQKTDDIAAHLEQVNVELAELAHHEQKLIETKVTLEKERERLVLCKHEQHTITVSLDQKQEELQVILQRLRTLVLQWKQTHKILIKNRTCASLDKEKEQMLEKITSQQKLIQKHLILKEQYLQYKNDEQAIVHMLKQDHQHRMQHHLLLLKGLESELENKKMYVHNFVLQQEPLQREMSELNCEIEQIRAVFASSCVNELLTHHQKIFEKRRSFYHTWIGQANILTQELKNIQHKQLFTQDSVNPSCPLCEQNLSASRKRFLKMQFSRQERVLVHRLQRLTRILKSLKEMLLEQHEHLEYLRKQLVEHNIMRARMDECAKRVQKIEESLQVLQQQYHRGVQELTILEEQHASQHGIYRTCCGEELTLFDSHDGYKSIQQHLNQLEQEIQKFACCQHEHELLINQLSELEQQSKTAQELQAERALQHECANKIHDFCVRARALKKGLQELYMQRSALSMLDEYTHQLVQQEVDHAARMVALQQQKERLLHARGGLERENSELSLRRKEYDQQQLKTKELNDVMYDYQVVATAVGKDGIQALMIEEALPEIEQEANMLLGQLTDNQAHIIIDSLRDLKKGGTKETLDIKISDGVGIRSYELFSGGEAFRIDFALHLAISRLLARRAGTSLQTLIIDEGFGSQDEDGLVHIMDALHKIQNNFCKIIIVSHLVSMKDQFPVHFFVEKGSQGSTVRVIEQG